MAISDIGHPFQGSIYYWVEATYGGGVNGSSIPVSSHVQNVRVGTGDRHTPIGDISSPTATAYLELTKEPTIHVEYNPQVGDSLMDDAIDRDACGKLQSLAFCIGTNVCETGNDVSYFLAVGAKAGTVRVSSSKNNPYTVTIDFECKSVATSNAASGTAPAKLSGALCQFNVAGSITKTGGFNPSASNIAYITNSIDVTFNHNLTGYTDHDTTLKDYLVEGELNVTGSCDITLDGGGAMHFGEVYANKEFDIVINMGGSGAPKLTLKNCIWDNSEPDINRSGEAIMESAPFTARPFHDQIVGTVT